ncbi:MAG: hypothetical protein QOJ46_1812 [bacterium]
MTTVMQNGSARPQDPLAKGLGVFSFALGVGQVLAPGFMNRMIGVREDAKSRAWMRAVGVREIAAGVGIFSEQRPKEWVWARVAGDTMDLALLGSALRSKSAQPGRTLAATGAVVGAFAADVVDGLRLRKRASDEPQEDKPMHVKAAITVRRDRAELYAFWHDFEGFPQFMAHLEEVRATSPTHSHWKARAPLGMTAEWDAEIIEDVPSERISWRSVEGSKIENSGTVVFAKAPGDQGTEVHVELHYAIPGGALGSTIAKLFGEEPRIQVKDDLRRFKQIVETGEIARSDGSPEGPLGKRQPKQRPAHPPAEGELAKIGGRS